MSNYLLRRYTLPMNASSSPEEKAAKDDKFISGASKSKANYTHKPSNRRSNQGHGGHNNRGGHQQQPQDSQNSQERRCSQSHSQQDNRSHSTSGNCVTFHKACQTLHPFGQQHCPLKNSYCYKCGKTGHTLDACRNPSHQNQSQQHSQHS